MPTPSELDPDDEREQVRRLLLAVRPKAKDDIYLDGIIDLMSRSDLPDLIREAVALLERYRQRRKRVVRTRSSGAALKYFVPHRKGKRQRTPFWKRKKATFAKLKAITTDLEQQIDRLAVALICREALGWDESE